MSDDTGERLYNPDGWGCGPDTLALLLLVVLPVAWAVTP